MREKDIVQTVTIKHQAVGTEATKTAVNSVTDAVKGLGNATEATGAKQEQAARRQASALASFEKMERSVSPAARALADYERAQKLVGRAVDQNADLQARGAAVLQVYRDRLAATGAAGAEAAKGTGLARHELINLSRQAQDVAVSLAGGQSPLTVLAQQGSQIADVFMSGTGTVRGFFGQLATGARAMITPVTAGIAAVTVLAASAAAVALQMDKLQTSSQRALGGAGARTGTTVGDLNRFTAQNSSAGGLSNVEARALGEEFTKTGEIVISRLHGMSDAVMGFANQTGKSVEEARKSMVAFATDPIRGMDELAKVFGSLDAGTRKAVEAMALAGDKTGAFQTIIDALSEKLKTSAQNLGFWEGAWRRVVNLLATEVAKPKGLEERIKEAEATLKEMEAGPRGGGMLGSSAFEESLERQRQAIQKLRQELEQVNTNKAREEINKLSTDLDAITNSILPQISQIEQLEAALAKLERAKAAGTSSKEGAGVDASAIDVLKHQKALQEESLGTTVRQARAVNELRAAWGGVSAQTAVALENLQGQLGVAEAVTGAERIAAQEVATRNNLLAQGVSYYEATLIAAKERQVAEAAATSAVLQQVEALKDQNRMIMVQGTAMEAGVAAAIAYKNAIQSGADATAAAALHTQVLLNYTLKAAKAAEQLANSQYEAAAVQLDAENAALDKAGIGSGFLGTPSDMPRGKFEVGPQGFGESPQGLARWAIGTSPEAFDAWVAEDRKIAKGRRDKFLTDQFGDSIDVNAGDMADQRAAERIRLESSFPNTERGRIESQIALLLLEPWNLARDAQENALKKSLAELTDSTDALNKTMQASLNPLYTEGRSALRIGYYKAARGLEGIVGGSGGTDSTPVHMMLTPGERVTVTPPGQSSNDNSRTVINNVTNIFGGSQSTTRRSARQASQGFAQMMAASS